MGSETELVKKALMESVKVKSSAWKYEREYRMISAVTFCERRTIENGGQADFIPFKREWVKHVDFGLRASSNDIQTMKELLKKEFPDVQLRRAVYHRNDYALDYQNV